MVGPDRLCRGETFVRVRRRHADVDDCGVRLMHPNLAQELRSVLRLADDLEPCLAEEPDDALACQHHVVGDDYAQGISARRVLASNSIDPPSAPIRSARWTRSERRGAPSSANSTTWRPSRAPTRAVTTDPPRASASAIASATVRYAAVSTASGYRAAVISSSSTASGADSASVVRARASPASARIAGK